MTGRSSCNECNSTDNLVTWEYQGKTFRKCMTPTCSLHKAFVVDKENTEPYTNYTTKNISDNNISFYITTPLRGLSQNTCEKIGVGMYKDNVVFIYNNSQKIRKPDKTMYWQNYNKDPGLFGINMVYDFNKPIYITEGEFDAASIVEVGLQAYSIAKGAGSAKQEVEENLEHLSKFSEIIFAFDNDKEGNKALSNCLDIAELPIEKVKCVDFQTFKDANECLCTDRELLKQICLNAKEFIPSGITVPTREALLTPRKPRLPTPFPQLNKFILGTSQQEGELIVCLADPKIGKSTFTKKWVKDTIDQHGIKVAVAYLEEPTDNCALSFITQDNQVPLESFKQDMSLIGEDEFNKSYDKYIESKKIIFIDIPFKKVSSTSFFTKLKYVINKGYKFIILDHITMLTYDMSEGDNERKTIDILMKRLRCLVNETGTTILVISHVKRPSTWNNKKDGESSARTVHSTEARGSGVFEQVCDVMLALERDLDSDSEAKRNELKIKVLLNRITGQTGYADTLYWIQNKGIMTTLENLFRG